MRQARVPTTLVASECNEDAAKVVLMKMNWEPTGNLDRIQEDGEYV